MYRVEGGFRSSKSDVKVGRAAGKTMLMCGRSYCAQQTLLLGSFILLGEGQLCDLMVAGVDLDCNNSKLVVFLSCSGWLKNSLLSSPLAAVSPPR